MTHARRIAKLAEDYFSTYNEIQESNKAHKESIKEKTKHLEELRKVIDGETGGISALLGKFYFLYSHTIGASVPKAVSDNWTEKQWELFESLGGARKETVSLKSVTKGA